MSRRSVCLIKKIQDSKQVKADFQAPLDTSFHWCASGKFKIESVDTGSWDDTKNNGFGDNDSTGKNLSSFINIDGISRKSSDQNKDIFVTVRCESLPAFPNLAGRWKLRLSPNMKYFEKKVGFSNDISRQLNSTGDTAKSLLDMYDVKNFEAVTTNYTNTQPQFGNLTTQVKHNYNNISDITNNDFLEYKYTPTTIPYDNLEKPFVDVQSYVLQGGNEKKLYEYDRSTGIDGSGNVSSVPVTFRVKYNNSGTKIIANAKLHINLDSELEYPANPCISLTGQASGKNCAVDGKVITVDLGTLNVNDQGQVEYRAQVIANPISGESQSTTAWISGEDSTNAKNILAETYENAKVLMYSANAYSMSIESWWVSSTGVERTNINLADGSSYKLKTVYQNTGLKDINYINEANPSNYVFTDSNGNGRGDIKEISANITIPYSSSYTGITAGSYEGNAIDNSGNGSVIEYRGFSSGGY